MAGIQYVCLTLNICSATGAAKILDQSQGTVSIREMVGGFWVYGCVSIRYSSFSVKLTLHGLH